MLTFVLRMSMAILITIILIPLIPVSVGTWYQTTLYAFVACTLFLHALRVLLIIDALIYTLIKGANDEME